VQARGQACDREIAPAAFLSAPARGMLHPCKTGGWGCG
jgi:hypothetical protein